MALLDKIMQDISLKKVCAAKTMNQVNSLKKRLELAIEANKTLAQDTEVFQSNTDTLKLAQTLLQTKESCLHDEQKLKKLEQTQEELLRSQLPPDFIIEEKKTEKDAAIRFMNECKHYRETCPRDKDSCCMHLCKNCLIEPQSEEDGPFFKKKSASTQFPRGSLELHLKDITYYYNVANDQMTENKNVTCVEDIVDAYLSTVETQSIISEDDTIDLDSCSSINEPQITMAHKYVVQTESQVTVTETEISTSEMSVSDTTTITRPLTTICESDESETEVDSVISEVESAVTEPYPHGTFGKFSPADARPIGEFLGQQKNQSPPADEPALDTDMLKDLIEGSLKTDQTILQFKKTFNKMLDEQRAQEKRFRHKTMDLLRACCSEKTNQKSFKVNNNQNAPRNSFNFGQMNRLNFIRDNGCPNINQRQNTSRFCNIANNSNTYPKGSSNCKSHQNYMPPRHEMKHYNDMTYRKPCCSEQPTTCSKRPMSAGYSQRPLSAGFSKHLAPPCCSKRPASSCCSKRPTSAPMQAAIPAPTSVPMPGALPGFNLASNIIVERWRQALFPYST